MIGKLNRAMQQEVMNSFNKQHNQKKILVDEAYYHAIQRDSEFLEILETCGVNHHTGWDEAVEIHEKLLAEYEPDGEEY